MKIDKQRFTSRWASLKQERSSWIEHYKEISDVIMPRSGRFFTQDRNKGNRRHNAIYDSTATKDLRILSAGLMAGMTSPARPWFKLALADKDLMKFSPVKVWLNDVTVLILSIFQRSNTYRALHSIYEELGAFGTGVSMVMDDFDTVIHHQPLTVGEYAIGQNFRGIVDTLYREFEKTVYEVVSEFGLENVSDTVKGLYDRGDYDKWIPIIHLVEPRAQRDTKMKDNLNMKFKSIYYEVGGDKNKVLSESGFKRFPALAPRWLLTGGDVYGSSPGMEALGDIRQLQHQQLRKAEVIDYQTKPPLQIPTSMKNREIDSLPGGTSFIDVGSTGIRPMFEVNLRLDFLLQDIQDVRRRIDSQFYADLFLMISQGVNTNMTATEVAERHEEKLLMLGPILERLHNELLDPMIEMAFDRIVEAGILPPPPEELEGHEINVEFVSMLAQAQRAVGTNSIDRFVGNLGMVARFKPDVLDKFDTDKWAEIYSEMLGVDPQLIIGDDKVAFIRQERAKAQQAQAQAAQMQTMATAAKDMGSVDTRQKNGLTDLMQQFSGYTMPQGGGGS